MKVRLNQYAPLDDFRRLRKNKTVGWPYRYTIGALSVAGEAVFPGRLFGGDHYNPFTATVHVYSDVPAIALHEGGHAKDFTRRKFPGTYALVAGLPVVDLWPEALATGDVLAYADKQPDRELEQEAYRILFPAYGTYVGGAAGEVAGMNIGLPAYAGAVVAGHVAGRKQARAVADQDAHEASVDANVAAKKASNGDHAAEEKASPAAFFTTMKRLAKTPKPLPGPPEKQPGTR